jgi:[acyl-carrier-protein] S-malonyltransferase
VGKLACLFPGQGSQFPGMGRDAAGASRAAREAFREADDALGFELSRLCFEGPEEELKRTANTQPAILTVSVAVWRALRERGRPGAAFAAGHSLGEYSALVAAGSLSFADAVRAVRLRGTWMQEAVPEGHGGMAALLGLEADAVAAICREAAEGQVLEPANFNAPGQIVVAGHAEAVERAIRLARGRGASRAVRLPVSAPFHCPLMAPAAARLAAHLRTVRFADPEIPVITNVDAEPVTSGEAARDALVRQVTAPVRWDASMRRLVALGVTRALEVGPGKVLCGLMRRIDRSVACAAVGDAAAIDGLGEGF